VARADRAIAILGGAWEALRDEHTSLYELVQLPGARRRREPRRERAYNARTVTGPARRTP
jgi:hypothetical protein